MKGDFTRFTHRPEKRYTRVLKQQGRVDLDADWNEAVEIVTHLERTEAIDVIGRCGVPKHGGGYKIERAADGRLTVSRGRIYVDGILCSNEVAGETDPIPLDEQPDLPGYVPPVADGIYLAWVDVWERHVTHVEDPEIREVALGGPDTTTRTRTVAQVRLAPLAPGEPAECQPVGALPADGTLEAQAVEADDPATPCAVLAGGGYRGLENRLYRVEIHDDGRDVPTGTPTFKWSRDNGSVVLPVPEGGVSGATVTVSTLGPDDELTVKVGDWVEVLGDATDLGGGPGTLAMVQPDGIDRTDREIELSEDVSAHAAEGHLKMRRWDHQETVDVALVDGALPIQADWFELEDGVQVRFDPGLTYHTGDYWVIPARTREGAVLWPRQDDGTGGLEPVALRRMGIEHHRCTLAVVERVGGAWAEPLDCRDEFPPLTEVGGGSCCIVVMPGESVQQAIDTVIGQGGGTVCLCPGIHRIVGALRLRDARDVKLRSFNAATVLRFEGIDEDGHGGIVVEDGERIDIEGLFVVGDSVPALVTVLPDGEWTVNRRIALRRLVLLNLTASQGGPEIRCGVRLSHAEGVLIDECRIAAEVGVACAWGPVLPDAASPPSEQEPESVSTVRFEDSPVGDRVIVGQVVTDSGVTITGETFEWSANQPYDGGYARFDDRGMAGGSGQDIQLNNINLSFALPAGCTEVTLAFADYGGNENLRLEGVLENVGRLADVDGRIIGGVRATVLVLDQNQSRTLGILRLRSLSGPITDFAIGGQELWIDDVALAVTPRPDLRYGTGVRELEMRDTRVRYGEIGVLALRSEGWQIDRSEIEPFAMTGWALLRRLFATGEPDSRASHLTVRSALEALLAMPAAAPRGTAIQAFLWEDGLLRQCRLGGERGVDAWWWFGGGARENDLSCAGRGLSAFWLHDADWASNRIECSGGPAMTFVGSDRATLAGNRTRGEQGLLRLSLLDALPDLLGVHARAVVRTYGLTGSPEAEQRALWILLEETANALGLDDVQDRVQALLDALYLLYAQSPDLLAGLPPATAAFFAEPPGPVLLMLAEALHGSLEALAAAPDRPPSWATLGPILPLAALTVARNDMRSRADTVLLEPFTTFGGLRIEDNRLDSSEGQTVRVNAWPYAVNVTAVVLVFRQLPGAIASLGEVLRGTGESVLAVPDLEEAWVPAAEAFVALGTSLEDTAARWETGLGSLLSTDLAIAGNTLGSMNTAIETNLFEMAILRNHITMRERPISAEDVRDVIGRLVEDEQLSSLGLMATTGNVSAIGAGRDAVRTDDAGARSYLDGPGSNERARIGYDATRRSEWDSVGARVSNDAADYRIAAAAGDVNLASAALGSLSSLLQVAINSYGIWAKGPGVRVVGNHVLVPQDSDENTWARGGIRLQGDEEVNLMTILLALLAEFLPDLDPLLGITDTVLGDNEVIGGVGNGIDVLETPGGKSILANLQALFDLKIRENQIRGMAGAGISIDPATLAVNVEIENNRIADCSNLVDLAPLTLAKGGISISNATLCRIRGNQISRCGRAVDAAGLRLVDILGLTLSDNRVLRNGGSTTAAKEGGLRLQRVYGAEVCDNQILLNGAQGLRWDNDWMIAGHQVGVTAAWPNLVALVVLTGLHLGPPIMTDLAAGQIQIADNSFRSVAVEASRPTAFELALIGSLALEGNLCYGLGGRQLGEVRVPFGVIGGNLFEPGEPAKVALVVHMANGAITSNVCRQGTIIFGSAPVLVRTGLNYPNDP